MVDNEFCISEVSDGLVVTGWRLNKTVVTKAAGFVTSQAAGEGMGRYTGGSKIGWLPNSNSSTTTHNWKHQRMQPIES